MANYKKHELILINNAGFSMKKFFLVILISFATSLSFAENLHLADTKKKDVQECLKVKQAGNELHKWMVLALKNDFSIGCPATSQGSPLFDLEILAQKESKCSEEAKGDLVAFYTLFTNHPNF